MRVVVRSNKIKVLRIVYQRSMLRLLANSISCRNEFESNKRKTVSGSREASAG